MKELQAKTGTVHQTDYKSNRERLKEVLRKAVELQCKLNELAEYLSMDGEFDREFAEAGRMFVRRLWLLKQSMTNPPAE